MGSDAVRTANNQYVLSFNPRSRMGSDLDACSNSAVRWGFNPRSRMGSDSILLISHYLLFVSIHAPVWGATDRYGKHPEIRNVSIHAPVWGATLAASAFFVGQVVSIHAPVWGATSGRHAEPGAVFCFNPRSRMGSDRDRPD